MERITLMKDGRITGGTTTTEQEDILPCLPLCVYLEQGYTLRSFFAMVSRHTLLQRMNPFLADAVAKAQQCAQQGCTTQDFSALEFSKTVELTGAPGTPVMHVFTSFRGITELETAQAGIEIRFHPLDMLLDMPVHLGRLRHVVFGDRTSMLECDTTFTLFEIIEGIAWELGFQGGSQQCSLRR